MDGVPVLRVPFLASYQPFWGWLAARSYRWEVTRRAMAIGASFPFELVHAHTAFLDGTVAAALSRRFNVPFLLTEHTGPFSALTATPGMRSQTERAVNSANLILAVSRHLRNAILAEIAVRHPERIRVLGNGVDLAQFGLHGAGSPNDGTVQVLWIGGFLPVKQPIMLIDAFAEAWARDGRLRLTMVGEGVLEANIRQRIAERGLAEVVCIRGSASRFDVATLMRAHHFLIVSSESETFCLVAVEAMACGRPVLTTRCGGPEETVENKVQGELVDNNAAALADGMVRLAARLDEFDEIKLHRHVKENWSCETIVSHLVQCYEAMLKGSGVDGVE
jgi:glycosyltransferase involved in cell wall biosynthesis